MNGGHSVIGYVKNKTEKLCDAAVGRSPGAIEYIDDPTFNQCITATMMPPFVGRLWILPTYERKVHTVLAHAASRMCCLLSLELSRSLQIEIAVTWIEMIVPAKLYTALQDDLNWYAINRLLIMIAENVS